MSQKKTNIIHVVEDASAETGGGVATVVKILTSGVSNELIQHEIVCNTAPKLSFYEGNIKITAFKKSDFLGWGYSGELKDFFSKKSKEPNTIFHVHGIWKAIQYFAVKASINNKTPCLISLHGTLEPNLSYSQAFLKRTKKNLYWKIFSNTFNRIKNVHAITSMEETNLKSKFRKSKMTIIPNSMKIHDNLCMPLIKENEKYFLFIGRLVAPKGIDILVKSFISSNLSPDYKLKIIGPIEDDIFWTSIKILIDQHESIEYLGFKSGKEKDELIANAWCLVLPSRMEAIGMVNLEAANLGCPSITTHETGLYDWEEGGGMLIESNSVDACKDALVKSSLWTVSERKTRGELSYNLVFKKYNVSVTNDSWKKLYLGLTSK